MKPAVSTTKPARFEIGHYRKQALAEGAALRFEGLSIVAA